MGHFGPQSPRTLPRTHMIAEHARGSRMRAAQAHRKTALEQQTYTCPFPPSFPQQTQGPRSRGPHHGRRWQCAGRFAHRTARAPGSMAAAPEHASAWSTLNQNKSDTGQPNTHAQQDHYGTHGRITVAATLPRVVQIPTNPNRCACPQKAARDSVLRCPTRYAAVCRCKRARC